jgi:hypothetical protein
VNARSLLFLAAALVAAACGKRGDPLPPLPTTPQGVTELRLAQRGPSLEVSYVAPRTTAGGARLGVLEVELLRTEAPGDFAKVARTTRRRVAPGETIVESEVLPPAGTVVRAAARAKVGGDASALSPVVSLTVQPAPPAPTGLTALLEPQAVVLTWVPPPTPPPTPAPSPSPSASPSPMPTPSPSPSPRAPGPSPSPSPGVTPSPRPSPSATPKPQGGFWVYRREPEAAYRRPLTPAPVAGPPFRDTTIAPGERWCYVVRTVVSTEPIVESASSPEGCVENRDVFPPAAPTGVAVLPGEDAVEVSWSPSLEADLASYRVYRASDGGPPARVADVPASDTTFRDASAPRGQPLLYTVTAVDRSGNESPPSGAVEARRP